MKISRLIIIGLLTFVIVKGTTLGCRMRDKPPFVYGQNNIPKSQALSPHLPTTAPHQMNSGNPGTCRHILREA